MTPLTPSFQHVYQLNVVTGYVLKIDPPDIATEFADAVTATAIQERVGGTLNNAPANPPETAQYFQWFDADTLNFDIVKPKIDFAVGDLLYPPSWSAPAPKPLIPSMPGYPEPTKADAPSAAVRAGFSVNAGQMADYFRRAPEGQFPAGSYWSEGNKVAYWSIPEQHVWTLLIKAERDAAKAANSGTTDPLFPVS